MRYVLSIALLTLLLFNSSAQFIDSVFSKVDKLFSIDNGNNGLVVLPAVVYSPESSLGFGVGGIYYFRSKKDTAQKYRPSNIQTLFLYTLENQILFTNPYSIFFDEEKHWVRGELAFYIYPYEYYGIGDDVDISSDNAEFYTADYIRFEGNYLKKIRSNFYAGPTLFIDHYFKIDTKDGGGLQSDNIKGIEPGTLLGLGASFTIDKRNNVFSPYKGYYIEGRALWYEDQIIGNYEFADLYLDLRKYYHPWNKLELGFQLYHQSIIGDPPFYNYALFGGGKRMRGYYKGAYRDHNQTILQTEARTYLFKRIVFAAFGGVGSVAEKFGAYDKLLGSYGVGLRYEIKKDEKLRIRLDYARGNGTDGFYININEAF